MIDSRPEGAYVKAERFPIGVPDAPLLFTIERVGGDGSVKSVGLTRDEARDVVGELNRLLYADKKAAGRE